MMNQVVFAAENVRLAISATAVVIVHAEVVRSGI